MLIATSLVHVLLGLFGNVMEEFGDSPIIGAGLYVDNDIGGWPGATGVWEAVLKTLGSF